MTDWTLFSRETETLLVEYARCTYAKRIHKLAFCCKMCHQWSSQDSHILQTVITKQCGYCRSDFFAEPANETIANLMKCNHKQSFFEGLQTHSQCHSFRTLQTLDGNATCSSVHQTFLRSKLSIRFNPIPCNSSKIWYSVCVCVNIRGNPQWSRNGGHHSYWYPFNNFQLAVLDGYWPSECASPLTTINH